MAIYREDEDRRCRPLEDEDLETTCLYVLENPVRAELCAQSSDWPWSACRFELG
jgi:hypothetical protein